ncbi:MAG: DegV family protein [Dehalococcoidales bacterium]|jgi:DegV family protein with EDD domain
MAVKIITDSTSDITGDLAQEMGITVVPLTVTFGHESFLDRVEITTDEFYRRLSRENIFPTTTQPSPGAFADVYNKLAEETDEILVVVISGKLSGTYQSATNAKTMVKKNCRIEVIDSLSAAMGLGLMVIAAAKATKKEARLDEIIDVVNKRIPRVHPIFYFETLKYLAKGGRIGKAQGLLGAMLSIKPLLTIKGGEITPLTRVRTKAAGMDYMYNFVAGFPHIEELAVEHCTTPDDADKLVERLSSIYPKERIYRSTISPVLGTYAGPNALAVTVLEADSS